MRNRSAILMVVMLAVVAVSLVLAAEPAGQNFPLENGTTWVYEGPVRSSQPGSEEVMEKVLTWNMKVTETIERQQVFAAVVEGHPLDLAFYEEGVTAPGTYLIIRVGEDQYYLLGDERVEDALGRLRDNDDVLTDLVRDAECFLDLPLEPGKIFGETFQLTRQDGMYFWKVISQEPTFLTDVEGAAPQKGVAQYGLSFLTTPDEQQVSFVPGLGFTRYTYNHHGSPASMDLRLVAYRSPEVKLTERDDGTAVEVAKGGTLAITLEGNPTTGYTWEVATSDESVLKLDGEPEFKAKSQAIGAGGMMTLRFRAEGVGKTDLKLVYHRPWEKDQEPAETFEVAVTVR